jgi:DNA (cytosine-5)-methyltransferase 1
MSRPRLLDLFCGAGGAAMGYHRAGFEVVGVDIKPQPHYPFEFHQGDALTWPLEGFDVIHASPPCQAFSQLNLHNRRLHGDLLPATRERLSGLIYVIENVPRAPLLEPIELCGAFFNLEAEGHQVRRHRLFESSLALAAPPLPHHHTWPTLGIYGDHGRTRRRSNRINDGQLPAREALRLGSLAMGIDWMSWRELTQAVPPAYTEFIGREVIANR